MSLSSKVLRMFLYKLLVWFHTRYKLAERLTSDLWLQKINDKNWPEETDCGAPVHQSSLVPRPDLASSSPVSSWNKSPTTKRPSRLVFFSSLFCNFHLENFFSSSGVGVLRLSSVVQAEPLRQLFRSSLNYIVGEAIGVRAWEAYGPTPALFTFTTTVSFSLPI